jgi:ATP synthase protein I
MPTPDDPLPSLDQLQQQIDEVKAQTGSKNKDNHPGTAYGQAMNMATQFIAGAAIGGAGGYYLDRWLDTSPLFLLAGFLLGFAGGVYNLMRAMGKKE